MGISKTWICFLGSLFLLGGLCPAGFIGAVHAQDDPSRHWAKALAECDANLSSFTSLKCRYTVTKGEAQNLDQAKRGKLENARSGDTIFVRDGDQFKLQRLVAAIPKPNEGEKAATKNGPVKARVEFPPFGFVQKGEAQFLYDPGLGLAYANEKGRKILPPEGSPIDFYFALSLDIRSPKGHLERIADKRDSLLTTETTQVDGIEVLHLRIRSDWGEHELFLDPQRGFLPLQTIEHTKGMGQQGPVVIVERYYVLEAKQFPSNRWFPMHVRRVVTDPAKPDGPWLVRDYYVNDLQIVKTPAREDLELNLPTGTRVCFYGKQIRGPSCPTFLTQKEEKIGPSDIGAVSDLLDKIALQDSERAQDEQAAPIDDPIDQPDKPINQPEKSRWWAWALLGIIVIVFCATLYRPFRRRAQGLESKS